MRHIQKKISLEQFKSRMPSVINAYDTKGVFYPFDGMSYPYSNYNMTPVDIKWNYGEYANEYMSYNTIASWYHFLISYYNGLKIDTACSIKVYPSYIEYFESDEKCLYSRESCLELDSKFHMIGGADAYNYMCTTLFPRYTITDDDLIDYWETDTLYINDVLKWIAWFDERVRYSDINECSSLVDSCCDCEEYKNRGGKQMCDNLKLFIDELQSKIDSIETRDEISDTDCTMITMPLFLSNSIDNMGEYSILSEAWHGGEDFHNTLQNSYGTVVSYNGNDWVVNGSSSLGYKYSDTYKEYYFGDENGMSDYELSLYNDGKNNIIKGNSDSHYTKYIDYYIKTHPLEFEKKLGASVDKYAYTENGILVLDPTDISMSSQYELNRNKNGYFIVNNEAYEIFDAEYIIYNNLNYEVKYDSSNNPYCLINNRRKFGIFNEINNKFTIEGQEIRPSKSFVLINNTMIEVLDDTITIKGVTYPKVASFVKIGDSILKLNDKNQIVSYGRDENILSLLVDEMAVNDGYDVDIDKNIFYKFNRYTIYDTNKITGLTESKLSSLFSDDIAVYDVVGNKLPGSLVKDNNGRYVEPTEGSWLDIYYKPMNMSHLSKDGDNYWGNIISSLSFYFVDKDNLKIGETETVYSMNGKYQSSLEVINDCIQKKDDLLNDIISFSNKYGSVGDLKCDIIYHMGATFNKTKIVDSGITYIDTVTLKESQCYYYNNETYCYAINYYDLIWEDIEYIDNTHNNKKLTTPQSVFEYAITDWSKDNDFTAFPLIREEYKLGTSSLENVKSDIYIDRGTARALDSHLKLMEIHSMESLENYGNSSFNIINN